MQNNTFLELKSVAQKSLEANIVSNRDKQFLCAGANHFKSLWTRDFCWSIGGLIAIDKANVAVDHLQTLIDLRNTDNGNIARIIDTIPSKLRISYSIAAQYLPDRIRHLPLSGTLKPEYKGEHGTYSFDANSLTILGANMISKVNGFEDFFEKNKQALIEIHNFYNPYLVEELVYQQKYGDWQDSVAREGASCYNNLLYWWATFLLNEAFGLNLESKLVSLKERINNQFFDKDAGLFKTHKNYQNYSLDAQLIAIESGFVTGEEAKQLYASLKHSELWMTSKLPGLSSFPNYPLKEKSYITRIVGLNHYHDDMVWSWLAGYSLRIAKIMNDTEETQRILQELCRLAQRDQYIFEIYSPQSPNEYFKTPLYKSEGPFSWGSGQILQSLSLLNH